MIRRGKEQWLALFEDHRRSGQSAAAFCKDNSLCAKYFSLRQRQLNVTKPKAIKTPFIKA